MILKCFITIKKNRDIVILFEPIYELSPKINQKRLIFGYVKNLYKICKKLDCKIIEYKLLDIYINKKKILQE